ncbi:SH3 domain-containing protein [Propionibacteriaceae bacterium G57]|uniref:SH3 domain-containing protein n=1 Tax=Aestuariimicrobium sp. G57 TaxID=3418485 RepID=UPI003DA71A14
MKKIRRLHVGVAAATLTGALTVGSIALSPTAIANYGKVTAVTAVNIRTSPSTSAGVLGVLYKGQQLTQTGPMNTGWVPVKFGDRTAWISANYLAGARRIDDTPVSRTTTATTRWTTEPLNVRSGPGTRYSKLGMLSKGSQVKTTGLVSGQFAQIEYSGGRAWVSTTYLTSSKPATSPGTSGGGSSAVRTTGEVRATANLAVRQSSGRPIAGYTDIPKGAILPVTGEVQGALTEVVWRGNRTWVTSAYLTGVNTNTGAQPEQLPQEIGTQYATEAVNVRSGPGTSYSIVGTVAQGGAVRVTGTVRNGFAQINYNGASRWVSATYLSKTQGGTGGGSGGGTTGPINLNGSVGLSGLEPKARNIVNVIASRFGMTTFYGVRPDPIPDHPSGHAVDIMLPNYRSSASQAKGWEIANYLRANARTLGVQYLIFDQKIWNISRDGEGWRAMSNRGSDTANHKDHVHVTTTGL